MQRIHRWLSVALCLMLLAACGGASTQPLTSPNNQGAATPAAQSPRRQSNPTSPTTAAAAATQVSGSQDAVQAPSGQQELPAATAAPALGGTVAGGAPVQEVPPSGSNESYKVEPAPTQIPQGNTNFYDPSQDSEIYDSVYFQNYGVNPFFVTSNDPLSTFSMDVDTASYGVMRRFINGGNLPDPDSVRVEEYLNYFNYKYPQPTDETAFAIYTEGSASAFGGTGYETLQIGIQGKNVSSQQRKPAALTFVIDVSGSMAREDRLGAVKQALALVVDQMREDDSIAIAVYGTSARTVLGMTNGSDKQRILDAINGLQSEGSTNVQDGLRYGFDLASQGFKANGINMILLCSDGVANNGVTDPQALLNQYQEYIDDGIQLSTFGFGMGNYNDILMEQLADGGNGRYAYIDTFDEAKRQFLEQLTGTLQTIARDAKIQVEFNPDVVRRYRLAGYENRDIADSDFRNNAVDAGEVGAGHSVTAVYEIKRVRGSSGKIATVRIRYQDADSGDIIEETRDIYSDQMLASVNDGSPRFKLALSVTQYAELLRHSKWVRDQNLESVIGLAVAAADGMNDPDVDEFVDLVTEAELFARP